MLTLLYTIDKASTWIIRAGKEARCEADRVAIPVRLIGLLELRQLYAEHYLELDEKTRSLVPLQKVYVVAG